MITLISYGKKNGSYDGKLDLHFSCMALPNPHHEENLRPLTGKDLKVQSWLLRFDVTNGLVDEAMQLVMKGKSDPAIGFMCHGGRHRSVALAELVALRLNTLGIEYDIKHRDL